MSRYRHTSVAPVISLVIAALLGVACPPGAPAEAATFTFTKIVDSSTPIPGTENKSFGLFRPPAIDGGLIAFQGETADEDFGGVYLIENGSLTAVADQLTPIPGGSGETFVLLLEPSLSGRQVAFVGYLPPKPGDEGCSEGDPAPLRHGLFVTTSSGALEPVATSGTDAPDDDWAFWDFGRPSLDAGQVAFDASVGSECVRRDGVFATTLAGVVKVAASGSVTDRDESLGGGFFGSVSRDGDHAVFVAETEVWAENGIFRRDLGAPADPLETIVRSNDPMPTGGLASTFGRIQSAVAREGKVAFIASDNTIIGLYLHTNGIITTVVETAVWPDPSREVSFEGLSFDGGAVAFVKSEREVTSEGDSQQALFTTLGGGLNRVLGTGDMLDGKTIGGVERDIGVGPQGLSGSSIAFTVVFGDGSVAIYRADLPEVDVGVAGGGFSTAKRVNLRRCGVPCTQDVTVKLKNFGKLSVPLGYSVSVVPGPAGTVLSDACAGVTGPVAPNKTVEVAGCTASYSAAGQVTLGLTVEPGYGTDTDPDNNLATAGVKVVP